VAVLAGQLTTGGAGDLFGATDIVQTARTAVATGTADTLKIVLASSPGSSITLMVYADSAGAPAALLGQTASTAVIAGTNSLALLSNITITNAVVYHLAMLVAGANVNLTDSTPGGYSGRTGVGAVPNPFGSTSGFSFPTDSLPMTIEGTVGAAAVAGFIPHRMPLGV
jgi:hypothetical protein